MNQITSHFLSTVPGADTLLNKLFYRLFPLPLQEGDLSISGHSKHLFLDHCCFLTSLLDVEGGKWSCESSCLPPTLPGADSGQMWGSNRPVNTELTLGYIHCYRDGELCSGNLRVTGHDPCRDHFPEGPIPSRGGPLMYHSLTQLTNAAPAPLV